MATQPRAIFLLNLPQETYKGFDSKHQRELCDELAAVIKTLQKRNQADLKELTGHGPWTQYNMNGLIDKLSWQMVLWLRYFKPCRIHEATPYVEAVLANNAIVNPALKDFIALIYHGASLSRTPGRYKDALASFKTAFDSITPEEHGRKSALYGRAMRSRILRRMGNVRAAEQDEDWLRKWALIHPFTYPPSEFIAVMSDPSESHNHILSHPSMASFGKGVVEFPGAGNGVFGRTVLAINPAPGALPDDVWQKVAAEQVAELTKAPAGRPPGFNPGEQGRKELEQCQWCWKARSEGAVLKNCSKCRCVCYCSADCQKKAWPTHKEICKEWTDASAPEAQDQRQLFKKFVEKHKPTFSECSVRALDVCADPSRSLQFAVVVTVKPRPNPKRAEVAFEFVQADVLSLDLICAMAPHMTECREHLIRDDANTKRIGSIGSLMTIVKTPDGNPQYQVYTGFSGVSLQRMRPGMEWKDTLRDRLNKGIVM